MFFSFTTASIYVTSDKLSSTDSWKLDNRTVRRIKWVDTCNYNTAWHLAQNLTSFIYLLFACPSDFQYEKTWLIHN